MTFPPTSTVGPVLILDDLRGAEMALSALFLAPPGVVPPPVTVGAGSFAPRLLSEPPGFGLWRARFVLPADRPSRYGWNGEVFEVAGDLTGDLRIAFVSCNGEERGDLRRDAGERNAMWARLGEEHRRAPFSILLHGGDQIYADEVTRGHDLSDGWPARFTPAPSRAALRDLRRHLRAGFAERYARLYAVPEFGWIAARVPSLMQWDDHDICDGWGSLSREHGLSPVGRTLFAVARENFLLFQQAARDDDLPRRFVDPAGAHLGWEVTAPGLRILAPDLRSERTRDAVMGPGGWAMMTAAARRQDPGQVLLVSSVPMLGPRLSLLERLLGLVPGMQKYEDDLRDQWQSRAHRAEWRRVLMLLRDLGRAPGVSVTAVSGEIHLATRATMALGEGRQLQQLVASGIAHRAPPKHFARVLGALASLGQDPLPEHPIRILPLPGQRARYVAERNFLMLERQGGNWQARWELEQAGTTGALPL